VHAGILALFIICMECQDGVDALPAHDEWKNVPVERAVMVRANASPLHLGSNTYRDEYGGMLKYHFVSKVYTQDAHVAVWKYMHVSEAHFVLFKEVLDKKMNLANGPDEVDGKIVFNCTFLEDATVGFRPEVPMQGKDVIRTDDIIVPINAHMRSTNPYWSCKDAVTTAS
jgi:hypothetical protein